MPLKDIQKAIVRVEKYYQDKIEIGPKADIRVTAVIENGLRCRIQSPDGSAVYTDMPESIGGTATANSPGWLSRAAIASCDATLLAIRAARKGIELDTIEVSVDAMSDGRGMFLDEGVFPGSLEVRIKFSVGSKDATPEQLQKLVDWVIAHSPVGNDIERPIDVSVEFEAM